MSANTFGSLFKVHSFGESHGTALGVVLEGIPSGVIYKEEILKQFISRRRPGQSDLVSARNESDEPEILSGVFEGKTLGTPVAVIVRNKDARSADYKAIEGAPRPGHADDMWAGKYLKSDPRGGGRSSGRETISRVIAGAFAQMFCQQLYPKMEIFSFAKQIGPLELNSAEFEKAKTLDSQKIDEFSGRFPSPSLSQNLTELLSNAKKDGKSFGGKASLVINNPPPYLGSPVFEKLKNIMASAYLSIGATCSFELGEASNALSAEGSQFHRSSQEIYGGIRGGISTGESIYAEVGFKPTSTVLDVAKKGRHDPCIIPRAIPVLEAMTWILMADQILLRRLDNV